MEIINLIAGTGLFILACVVIELIFKEPSCEEQIRDIVKEINQKIDKFNQ